LLLLSSYLSLDVHKDSVTIAALPADAMAPTRIDKDPKDFAKRRRVFERHAKDGALRGDAQWKLYCLVHNIEKLANTGYTA